MKDILARFVMLGALLMLLGIVVATAPKPAHAAECVCLHWSGIDGPCDNACKAGYTYCQQNPHGSFSGDNGEVQGPCLSGEFRTVQECDNFFGCLVCTQYSGDCGGGGA